MASDPDPAVVQRNIESLATIGGVYDLLCLTLEADHLEVLTAWRLAHPSKSALECLAQHNSPLARGTTEEIADMPKATRPAPQKMETQPLEPDPSEFVVDPQDIADAEAASPAAAGTPEGLEANGPAGAPTEAPAASKTPPKAAPRGKTAARSLFGSLVEQKEYARILYWGREGSGKTTSALTLSSLGRVLVINAEGGLKRKALEGHGVVAENVMLYPPVNEPITHAGLDEVFRQIKADLAKDPDSWVGVVFDSATDVVTGMVGAAGDDRVKKARNRGATIDEFDQWFTDRGDYGVASKMFRDLLRKYRSLDCHLIVTALERRDVDDDTSEVFYGPAVNAAIANDLLGYVDVVAATRPEADGKPFRALTKGQARVRTKDRFGVLPEVMANPTAARVVQYINGDLTEATDPDQALLGDEPVKASGKIQKAK